MLKLNSFLYQKISNNNASKTQGGASEVVAGDPTKGYPGGSYGADCVIDTDCGDGTTGADVMRGTCCP